MTASVKRLGVPFRWSAQDGLGANGKLVARSYRSELEGVFSRAGQKWAEDQNGLLALRAHSVPPFASISGEECLLLESAGTNLLTRSADFSAWDIGGASVATNQSVAPDGTTTVDVITPGLFDTLISSNVTYTGDGVKAFGLWLKAGSAATTAFAIYDVTAAALRHQVLVTWTAGVPTLSTQTGAGTLFPPVYNARSGMWLVSATAAGVIAANTNRFELYPDATSSVDTVSAWGAQTENAAALSSYMPTAGAAASRLEDALYFPLSLAPQAATLYVRFVERGMASVGVAQGVLALGDGSNPSILLLTGGVGYYAVNRQGADQGSGGPSGTAVVGDLVELRLAIASTGALTVGQSINGGTETVGATSAAQALPTAWAAARLHLGSRGASTAGLFGFTHACVATGTKTMAEMRAVAEAT